MQLKVFNYLIDTEVSIISASSGCFKVFRYAALLSLEITKLNNKLVWVDPSPFNLCFSERGQLWNVDSSIHALDHNRFFSKYVHLTLQTAIL